MELTQRHGKAPRTPSDFTPDKIEGRWKAIKARGRPSLLTPELIDAITDDIATTGSYTDDVCDAHGISRASFYNWQKTGEEHLAAGITDSAPAAFLDALKRARGFVGMETSRACYTGDPAWIPKVTHGERTQPDKWGKRGEDSSGPRILVQIGVRDGDVQVQLGPAPPANLALTA